MDEVTGILIAVGALIAGLLVLGWAYGDFNRPSAPAEPTESEHTPSA